jgi:hypothetical protein
MHLVPTGAYTPSGVDKIGSLWSNVSMVAMASINILRISIMHPYDASI